MTSDREVRWQRVAQVAMLLVLAGVVVGYFTLDRKVYPAPQAFVVMMAPVASAGLLFVLSAILAPNLVPSGRILFPLTLTLPVVFVVLLRVSVLLWTSSDAAAFRASDAIQPALLWSRWYSLSILGLVQFGLVSIKSLIDSRIGHKV